MLISRQPVLADQVTEGWKLNAGWKTCRVSMRGVGHWLLHLRYTFFCRSHLANGWWWMEGLSCWSGARAATPVMISLGPMRRSAARVQRVRTTPLLCVILVGGEFRATVQGFTLQCGSLRELQASYRCGWTNSVMLPPAPIMSGARHGN
jgi:hypothetical protein